MKGALLIGAIILFIIVFYNVCNDAIEEFRGRGGGHRGGGGRRGGGSRRGGFRRGGFRRGGFRRHGFNPNRYVRRFRRGGGWMPRRRNYWYDSFSWPTTWLGWGACKKGCTPDGCPVPGNNYDECVWASDCYGCYY